MTNRRTAFFWSFFLGSDFAPFLAHFWTVFWDHFESLSEGTFWEVWKFLNYFGVFGEVDFGLFLNPIFGDSLARDGRPFLGLFLVPFWERFLAGVGPYGIFVWGFIITNRRPVYRTLILGADFGPILALRKSGDFGAFFWLVFWPFLARFWPNFWEHFFHFHFF